jgi:hypothetical protein
MNAKLRAKKIESVFRYKLEFVCINYCSSYRTLSIIQI